jgi:hypothetical protein
MEPTEQAKRKPTKRKPSNKLIIEALNKTGGNLSATAILLGATRQSVYNWLNANKELKAAREQSLDSLLDMAESKLFAKVKNGDLTAIIFTLKTQGKSRGYVERQEVQFDKNDIVEVGYKDED